MLARRIGMFVSPVIRSRFSRTAVNSVFHNRYWASSSSLLRCYSTASPLTETATDAVPQQQQPKRKKRRVLKWLFIGLAGELLLSVVLCTALVKTYHALSLGDPEAEYYSETVDRVATPAVQVIEGIQRANRTIGTFTGFLLQKTLIEKICELKLLFAKSEEEIKQIEEEKQQKMRALHEATAKKALEICKQNGGVYVKMGQSIANSRGFMPDVYCDTMKVLQDAAPYVSFSEVEKLFRREFGKSISEVFESFEPTPIAAASLAQVHRATLKDGRRVAVKIQYPKVGFYFHGDFITSDVMMYLTKYTGSESDREAWERMQQDQDGDMQALSRELNFKSEAQNMERAKALMANERDVYVPGHIKELSSERILTMEFIDGVNVTDAKAIQAMGFSVAETTRLMFEALSKQLFIHGYFHADPHGSNIFVRPNPNNKSRPQIVILDHGLYKELSDEFRVKFAQFWIDVTMGNKQGVKSYCDSYGIEHPEWYQMLVLMQANDDSFTTESQTGHIEDKKMTEQDAEQFMSLFMPSKEEDIEKLKTVMNNLMLHMPQEMTLILRAQQLMRSINQELGVPVNRFSIMARIAREALQQHQVQQQQGSLLGNRMQQYWERAVFAMRLKLIECVSYLIHVAVLLASYMPRMRKSNGAAENTEGNNNNLNVAV